MSGEWYISRGYACDLCYRPVKKVICRICGFIVIGRVMRPCPVHPDRIWHLDVSVCPRCEINLPNLGSEWLDKWVVEHDLKEGEAIPVNKLIEVMIPKKC